MFLLRDFIYRKIGGRLVSLLFVFVFELIEFLVRSFRLRGRSIYWFVFFFWGFYCIGGVVVL